MIEYRHAYVHVPFCSRRCSYCDFSIAVRKDIPAEVFGKEILSELSRRSGTAKVDGLDTLYFGGGTPSKLASTGISALLAGLQAAGLTVRQPLPNSREPDQPLNGTEVTLEANPEDLTEGAGVSWLEAGVNRLSVGVQSFDPEVLEWMHRTHSAGQSAAAVRAARSAGFTDISLDLIYALPERLGRDWDRDLDLALELEPDHLSVYGLTVEPRTPLGRWTARGDEVPETDDHAAEQFLAAHERLTAAGFEHYEVSSYAKPGRRSRHNTAYWQRVPYLGLGPSAHSFDGSARRWNISAFAEWERMVTAGEDPVGGVEELTSDQSAAEDLYLGLRTDSGIDIGDANAARTAAVMTWVREGWAKRDGSRVRLTPEGWLRLDALVSSLSAGS